MASGGSLIPPSRTIIIRNHIIQRGMIKIVVLYLSIVSMYLFLKLSHTYDQECKASLHMIMNISQNNKIN